MKTEMARILKEIAKYSAIPKQLVCGLTLLKGSKIYGIEESGYETFHWREKLM
jgi:hypothetical protein